MLTNYLEDVYSVLSMYSVITEYYGTLKLNNTKRPSTSNLCQGLVIGFSENASEYGRIPARTQGLLKS